MTMSFTSLTSAKGVAGSIANWVGLQNIDTQTILDEAQSVIFQSLRVREMRTEFTFSLAVGQSRQALPTRFLDPIGRIRDQRGQYYKHKIESDVLWGRQYQTVAGGNLGANPITTGAINTSFFNANVVGHTLTQGSDITFANLTSPIDGINVNGIFPVFAVIDANNITCSVPSGDQAIAGNVTDGGSSGTWTANMLINATPVIWSIWDESLQFDAAAVDPLQCRLLYFRSPILLSATNPTNFLTARYPMIIRIATSAAGASFRQDDAEEQKWLAKLSQIIDATNMESDLIYRGADISTDTPKGGNYGYGEY